jgi:septal ring factor EnvC (AmiA/AmiB activator)
MQNTFRRNNETPAYRKTRLETVVRSLLKQLTNTKVKRVKREREREREKQREKKRERERNREKGKQRERKRNKVTFLLFPLRLL